MGAQGPGRASSRDGAVPPKPSLTEVGGHEGKRGKGAKMI